MSATHRLSLLLPLWPLSAWGTGCADFALSASPPSVDAGTDGSPTDDAPKTDAFSCAPGQIVCLANTAYVCDANHQLGTPQDCTAVGTCADGLGCVRCQPKQARCESDVGHFCLDDGSEEKSFVCDPLQGMRCEPSGCIGACTPTSLTDNHLGCDFWPTMTANAASAAHRFAVLAVAAALEPVTLRVTRGEQRLPDVVIDASLGFALVELDWVAELKGPAMSADGTVVPPAASIAVPDGAYRLRSDSPVALIQLNTNAGNTTNNAPPLSNDASLLMPAPLLGLRYRAVGWHAWERAHVGDALIITGTQNATEVFITPTSPVLPFQQMPDPPEFIPNEPTRLTLQAGEVLQLFTTADVSSHQWAGASIVATNPIQVLTGMPCAAIGDDRDQCDHLEEAVPQVHTFGTQYVASAPASPASTLDPASGSLSTTRHFVRIHGLESAAVVHLDPAPESSKPLTVRAGETVELELADDVYFSADVPFAVTQFLPAGEVEDPPGRDAFGDPSQSVLVPVGRFLKSYVFAPPPGFPAHALSLVAHTGTKIAIDDEPVTASFVAIGASGLSAARIVGLAPGRRYVLSGDAPFGAQLYGYGPRTSYMVPLGMDLRSLGKASQ